MGVADSVDGVVVVRLVRDIVSACIAITLGGH